MTVVCSSDYYFLGGVGTPILLWGDLSGANIEFDAKSRATRERKRLKKLISGPKALG